jgi:hypothetical protein
MKILSLYIKQNIIHLQLNMVWVSCQGENPADRENIGPIQYLPYRGFPGYYFPYTNQEGYLSPLVAVHFQRPKSKFKALFLIDITHRIFNQRKI